MDKIEQAIESFRNGDIIIVVDDEDRENEGDFICAAEKITPEKVNFMLNKGRGLLCVAIPEKRCEALELNLMVGKNTALHETPFTVSVDVLSPDTTTGISTADRAKTILALVDEGTQPSDLARPGHIFPLKARTGGVLRRAGHTEAAVDFARLSGLKEGGVLIEILQEDGTVARLPELKEVAKVHNMNIVSVKELIKYRMSSESLVKEVIGVDLPTHWGSFNLRLFENIDTKECHLALAKGAWSPDEPILVRVHSSCLTGDVFGSCRCDCGEQLHHAMLQVEKEGKGVVLYMNQEGRGIGLANKLRAYKLQEQGMDTVEANIELGFKADERDYGIGAQILKKMNVGKLRLMSNNPKKRIGMSSYGLEVVENVSIEIAPNNHNERYLEVKRDKLGHNILK